MNVQNPFTLTGKTILVTGASSGIGQATAIECSKMGARLIFTGRNKERLAATAGLLVGDGHKSITADLTNVDDIKMLIDSIEKVDGAVLCAGISDTTLIPFCSTKKFQHVLDTNLLAPTEIIRLLTKKKKFTNPASVVVISSIAAFRSDLGNAQYGASKAALSAFVKYAARELSKDNIRCNSICPGMVDTPLIHNGSITEEQLAEDGKNYPLGRYGKPQDIAYAAIYLLSDASAWVTGIDLIIDGGVTI